jgi:hypothetical protein
MGAAGRERVRTAFAWPVVARQYHDLVDELASIRAGSPDPVIRQPADPVRGDPFLAFAGFPNAVLALETTVAAAPGATGDMVRGLTGSLDTAFSGMRASLDECAQALDRLVEVGPQKVSEVLLVFPAPRRRGMMMAIAWMAKQGLVDWRA